MGHTRGMPCDRDGLHWFRACRVAAYGDERVCGVVESMNGARFVRDELVGHGWEVLVAGRAEGQGAGPVGVQDRQDRCARAGRALPAWSGAPCDGKTARCRDDRSAAVSRSATPVLMPGLYFGHLRAWSCAASRARRTGHPRRVDAPRRPVVERTGRCGTSPPRAPDEPRDGGRQSALDDHDAQDRLGLAGARIQARAGRGSRSGRDPSRRRPSAARSGRGAGCPHLR